MRSSAAPIGFSNDKSTLVQVSRGCAESRLATSGAGLDLFEFLRGSAPKDLMRHHDPARWPADDGLGRPAPHDLVEPGMMIGPQGQKVVGIGVDEGLENLAYRAPANLDSFEARLDAGLREMADQ